MLTVEVLSSSAARQQLEELWLKKTLEAHERYQIATHQYVALLKESHGLMPLPETPLASAHKAQTLALAEFRRILKILTELTVNGRIPDQESAGNGVRP